MTLDSSVTREREPICADEEQRRWLSAGNLHTVKMQTGILAFLVLTVQLVPSIPFYFGLAGSLAAGTVVAAGTCIVTVAICWAISARGSGSSPLTASADVLVLILLVTTVVLLHGVVADQIIPLDSGRFLASMVPLVLLLCGGFALSIALRGATQRQIVVVCWISFWAFCIVILLKISGLQPRAHALEKSTFPFAETSHFVLAFGPIFLFRCASASQWRRNLWVIFGFALAVALRSGTLMAFAFLGALVSRRLLIVLGATLAVLLVGLAVDLKYFTSRADISSHSKNISALVYVEGWEMLGRSLRLSDGWGIGFQQLGIHGSNVGVAETIRHLTDGESLNVTDGSFVLAKFGSEFGIFGLALVLLFCAGAFRSLLVLRSGRGPPRSLLAHSIIVGYGVNMFVRAAGYFTEAGLLFVGAVLVLIPIGRVIRIGTDSTRRSLLVLR